MNKMFRRVAYPIITTVSLLLAAAFIVPNFVKARWTSSGVPVNLKLTVTDAQTGQAIPGAEVVVWLYNDWRFPANARNEGDISATTDDQGHCIVHSHFPGSGKGDQGRLRVNSTIWVRVNGYESCQQPMTALLGSHLDVTGAFQTNSFPMKIKMRRRYWQ